MARNIVLVVVLALAACSADEPEPVARSIPRPSPSPSRDAVTETPPRSGPEPPIRLGPLPRVGIAVDGLKEVVLLDMAGNVIRELHGFSIEGNVYAPGLWLKRDSQYFRLSPRRAALVPVWRSVARSRMYEEPDGPDLPPPPGTRVKGRGVAGYWRHAFVSDDGTTLAQWSGECEVPTTYWLSAGGEPEIVTGGTDLSSAPESLALGWAPDGRAVVFLPSGLCSTGTDPRGIYTFTAPGVPTLFHRTRPHSQGSEMWFLH